MQFLVYSTVVALGIPEGQGLQGVGGQVDVALLQGAGNYHKSFQNSMLGTIFRDIEWNQLASLNFIL